MRIQNKANQMAALWIEGCLVCVLEPQHNALPEIKAVLEDMYPEATDIILAGHDFTEKDYKAEVIATINQGESASAVIVELTWVSNRSNRFPNGFSSWQETHFEISSAINMRVMKYGRSKVVDDVREADGMGGLWELAKDLTDAFEKDNEDREWDGEWIDEIDAYINAKLN